MDFTKIKLPIAIIGIIIAQAFGIIWYVATLDSTVSQLQTTVEEIRLNTAETSVAVIQNDIANIKINVAKLEQNAISGSEPFDDSGLWTAINEFNSQFDNIFIPIYDDEEVRSAIEELQITLEGISSPEKGVTSKELKEATQAISTKLQNVLDGKGATWKKSQLKARIEALEKAIEDNHPPKKNKKNKK